MGLHSVCILHNAIMYMYTQWCTVHKMGKKVRLLQTQAHASFSTLTNEREKPGSLIALPVFTI